MSRYTMASIMSGLAVLSNCGAVMAAGVLPSKNGQYLPYKYNAPNDITITKIDPANNKVWIKFVNVGSSSWLDKTYNFLRSLRIATYDDDMPNDDFLYTQWTDEIAVGTPIVSFDNPTLNMQYHAEVMGELELTTLNSLKDNGKKFYYYAVSSTLDGKWYGFRGKIDYGHCANSSAFRDGMTCRAELKEDGRYHYYLYDEETKIDIPEAEPGFPDVDEFQDDPWMNFDDPWMNPIDPIDEPVVDPVVDPVDGPGTDPASGGSEPNPTGESEPGSNNEPGMGSTDGDEVNHQIDGAETSEPETSEPGTGTGGESDMNSGDNPSDGNVPGENNTTNDNNGEGETSNQEKDNQGGNAAEGATSDKEDNMIAERIKEVIVEREVPVYIEVPAIKEITVEKKVPFYVEVPSIKEVVVEKEVPVYREIYREVPVPAVYAASQGEVRVGENAGTAGATKSIIEQSVSAKTADTTNGSDSASNDGVGTTDGVVDSVALQKSTEVEVPQLGGAKEIQQETWDYWWAVVLLLIMCSLFVLFAILRQGSQSEEK